MQRVWGLDLLRAVAVIGVLYSHFPPHTGVAFVQKVLPVGGIFGVELFFVLSGFLIGQILIREFVEGDFTAQRALNFMKRRWFRTLPNYYLFFLGAVYMQYSVGFDVIAPFIVFMQNVVSRPEPGFYGVTWSLTIEEIFYVTFPLSLWLINKTSFSKDTKFFSIVLLFILAPFLIRIVFYDSDVALMEDYRKAAVIRLDAIAYGVLMAFLKLRVNRVWCFLSKQGGWLLIPFWYFFLFNKAPRLVAADWATFYYPFCSAMMALTLPFFDKLKLNTSIFAKPVSFIALISYSLYLCHIPVIILSNRFLSVKSFMSGHALEVYYVMASVLCAYLVHILYEKPMTNLRDKF